MRYQSALVLSTLAIGQAAAASNLRHASFHARRSAKAGSPQDVAWTHVVRDAVDYKAATDKITHEQWAEIFASKGQPSAAPAAPVPEVEASSPDTPSKAEPVPENADPTSNAAPAKTKEATASNGSDESDVLKALGCSKGKNDKSPNGSIWIGDSGAPTQVTFTNDADEDSAVLCVSKEGMFTTKSNALIAWPVKSGEQLTLSVADGFSGSCGAAYSDSKFHMSGILEESIFEFTTGNHGTYDISREVNMNGIVISAVGGNQCTSGVKNGQLSCAFGCKDGASVCEATGTYNIIAGAEAENPACMAAGKDPITGGASGGCRMTDGGDHIKVTYSKNRSWPAATF